MIWITILAVMALIIIVEIAAILFIEATLLIIYVLKKTGVIKNDT